MAKSTAKSSLFSGLQKPDIPVPPTKYDVAFMDRYGNVMKNMQVDKGEVPTAPVVENYEDESFIYTHTGWTPSLAPVDTDVTYVPVYDKKAKEIEKVEEAPSKEKKETAKRSSSKSNSVSNPKPVKKQQEVVKEEEEAPQYVRHTFYVTPEIVEAIKELAYRESRVRKKGTSQTFQSDIVREVFEAGLEKRCPGIMKEMKELLKQRNE